ncbi:MAG: threonine synthase [Pseudomonadota bacterium]
MRYVSTRGAAPVLPFDEALLAGLASDGGLYVPQSWPRFEAAELKALAGRPYDEVALAVMARFVGGAIPADALERCIAEAYRGFTHKAVAPLKQIGANDWLLELFHGPTLAFKDYALQLVGRLFDHVLTARRRRATIVGATSGDTGSAAIAACRDRATLDIFILHPRGRVSEVQRRQMTTVMAANVHNLAIDGTFDDCQDLIKGMFNDRQFRDGLNLSAVNSINWARIAAQAVYYVYAGLALGAPARKVAFSVPTGNFGNIFAGYVARRLGLPIARLVIASNRNDILARCLATGEMRIAAVEPSPSPSMDIQVASNFERLLFELADRDGPAVAAIMQRFRQRRLFRLSADRRRRLGRLFDGARADDEQTLATIARMLAETGALVDPHTAVGLYAAAQCRRQAGVPMVTLATAHPAKFPDAVARATGIRPRLPPPLADLLARPERVSDLPNDLAAVKDYVRGQARVAA